MADDPRGVLIEALNPWVFRDFYTEDIVDAALAALDAAGWRLVREGDLRWLVDNLEHIDSAYWPRGDEIPPGMRALMEQERES